LNSNTKIINKIQKLPDLGEMNMKSLDYSQINTVKINADTTYKSTKEFITNLENEMKTTPLIDPEDNAFKYYLDYNTAKQEMKKIRTRVIFRRLVCIFLVLVLFGGIAYLIVYKTKGGDNIDVLNDDNLDDQISSSD
jgi:hypothetical protein